jgi:hypothetical protein
MLSPDRQIVILKQRWFFKSFSKKTYFSVRFGSSASSLTFTLNAQENKTLLFHVYLYEVITPHKK